MKQPLTNALIYFVVAGVLYLLLLVSPEEIGFYGLLFFYLIHFPGVILISLFYRDTMGEESRYLHYIIGFVLVTVNALLVFLFSWIVRMKVQAPNETR